MTANETTPALQRTHTPPLDAGCYFMDNTKHLRQYLFIAVRNDSDPTENYRSTAAPHPYTKYTTNSN